MQDYQHDYQRRDSDNMETLTPAAPPAAAPEARTSEGDAGVDDAGLEEAGPDELPEDDLDEDLPAPPHEEISVSDLGGRYERDLEAPELSDLNVPGEVDIEDLDEDALDGTDLPSDARLDPLDHS